MPNLQDDTDITGMSETSGLTMDEVLVTNAGMILLTDAILSDRLPGLPEDLPAGCSGIGVWDQYTEDGSVIFGRNWDIDRASMREYMEFLSVVLLHPDDGYVYANIHPLGNVYLESGMNEFGLFIELNNGGHSDPSEPADRQNTASVLVDVLRECRDVEEAVLMLKGIPADLSYILQIADPANAVSLERGTFDARVRDPDDEGLVIAVNHFIPPYPPEWNDWIQPPRTDEDDPRYSNMLHLAQSPAYMGHFTPELMQEYLMVPMEEGGAYHAGTVYQVVAVPETRTIWLHACEYSEWEEIPLVSLLK
ncbi:C45 family autoproteolytic acyltransferase/hydolase [Methanocalculus sp. MC3]